jgi:hypothetical protein
MKIILFTDVMLCSSVDVFSLYYHRPKENFVVQPRVSMKLVKNWRHFKSLTGDVLIIGEVRIK